MQLNELLEPWVSLNSQPIIRVNDIKNDSRLVGPGDVFIAYPGAAADGRLFIEKAVQAGAVAVLYEPKELPPSVSLPAIVPCIPIDDLITYLPTLAQRFYANPGAQLTVTGVTGTNGKTTIAYQLAQAHELLGQHAAYIGTIGQGRVNALQLLDNTTPDALHLQKLLHQYRNEGIQQVCMEVSSHALCQHRVEGVPFKQALFTNLTLDHLDYHHTMDAYGAAKARLFAQDCLEYAIINQDDSYQYIMCRALKPHVEKITYGMQQNCDVRVTHWQMDIKGTTMDIESVWGKQQVTIQALGAFNIYNSLAVFTSLMVSGYPVDKVIAIMHQLQAAPGRMEVVRSAPYVLVDYAHTPDALENVLRTLQQLKIGQLWVIFGCGGDRDKSKRPIMGKTASRYADKIIITSDNPRSEDPQTIIDEVAAGITTRKKVIKLKQREEAIAYALSQAEKDDIILVAGKGHEAYQQIGAVKYAFSDQDIIRKWSNNSTVSV